MNTDSELERIYKKEIDSLVKELGKLYDALKAEKV
jgi:hypothetical protein